MNYSLAYTSGHWPIKKHNMTDYERLANKIPEPPTAVTSGAPTPLWSPRVSRQATRRVVKSNLKGAGLQQVTSEEDEKIKLVCNVRPDSLSEYSWQAAATHNGITEGTKLPRIPHAIKKEMGLLMPSNRGRLPRGAQESLYALSGRVLAKGRRLRSMLNTLDRNVKRAKQTDRPDPILDMLGEDDITPQMSDH